MIRFAHLKALIEVEFGQDHELFGDSTEEIMADFNKSHDKLMRQQTLEEVELFLRESSDIDADLEKLCPWVWYKGYFEANGQDFLNKVAQFLRSAL